jgi:hypothetical protein
MSPEDQNPYSEEEQCESIGEAEGSEKSGSFEGESTPEGGIGKAEHEFYRMSKVGSCSPDGLGLGVGFGLGVIDQENDDVGGLEDSEILGSVGIDRS